MRQRQAPQLTNRTMQPIHPPEPLPSGAAWREAGLDRNLFAAVDAEHVARQPLQALVREHGDRLRDVFWRRRAAAGVADLYSLQQVEPSGMRRSAGVSVTPARMALAVTPSGASSKASWRMCASSAAFAADTAP